MSEYTAIVKQDGEWRIDKPPDGCRVVLPICYDNIVQLGDTSTNYQLAPGDRIFVPSHWCFDCLCYPDHCGPCHQPHGDALSVLHVERNPDSGGTPLSVLGGQMAVGI